MKSKILIVILFLILSGQILAQDEVLPVVRESFFNTHSYFQIWKVEGHFNPIIQFSFPVMLVFPMGSSNFNLTISHTPAYSLWGQDRKIYGLSDTWIQGSYLFWDDKAMLNLGAGTPTGKVRLNNNEFALSQWLSRSIFRFRLPIYGQGFCGNGGLAFAIPIGETVVLGLGGQYLYRTSYYPVEYEYEVKDVIKVSAEKYSPGDEISGQFGLDVRVTRNTKVMLDGMYSYYWPDLLSGRDIYGSGKRLLIDLGIFYKFGKQFVWTNISYRQKGKNLLWQGVSLEEEEKKTEGDQFEMDFLLEVLAFENGGILLMGDGRYYKKNDVGREGAYIYGGGFGANVTFGENSRFDFHCKYLRGKLLDEINRSIQGLEIFIGLKLEL